MTFKRDKPVNREALLPIELEDALRAVKNLETHFSEMSLSYRDERDKALMAELAQQTHHALTILGDIRTELRADDEWRQQRQPRSDESRSAWQSWWRAREWK